MGYNFDFKKDIWLYFRIFCIKKHKVQLYQGKQREIKSDRSRYNKSKSEHTRKVELIWRIETKTTSCWKQRSSNGRNRARTVGVTNRSIHLYIVALTVKLLIMMSAVRRWRRRSMLISGASKRKLKQSPDFTVRWSLLVSDCHLLTLENFN